LLAVLDQEKLTAGNRDFDQGRVPDRVLGRIGFGRPEGKQVFGSGHDPGIHPAHKVPGPSAEIGRQKAGWHAHGRVGRPAARAHDIPRANAVRVTCDVVKVGQTQDVAELVADRA